MVPAVQTFSVSMKHTDMVHFYPKKKKSITEND